MRSRRRSSPALDTKPLGPLKNPFPPYCPFSEDWVAHIHEQAVIVLRDLGIRVLLDEARALFKAGGARVEEDMVFLDPDGVREALANAPSSFMLKGAGPDRHVPIGPRSLMFQPGAGAPNATDLTRGRRPGSAQDFRELVQICEAFDVLQSAPPIVEPQDIPPAFRHLDMTDIMLRHSSKVPVVYARGRGQVLDCFDMIRCFRGLEEGAFAADPHCYTVINTNSPRQLDVPMAQGLIDFARAGQLSVITPFTLMGAMAPITVAGALTLSHAEALAAITLTQLAKPGAPVLYGTFTSNVHMRSGSPAFGTPEHFQASAGAGQLARHIGLPWRSATGTAANLSDAQGAHETQMGLWGCLMGGANAVFHAAGWLEGGLSVSYEKLVTDTEVLTMMAQLCQPLEESPANLGLDSLAEVSPGGHFFETQHTLDRYRTAFYEPLVFETQNFEAWEEAGSQDIRSRATRVWQDILSHPKDLGHDSAKLDELSAFTSKRRGEGGAEPLS